MVLNERITRYHKKNNYKFVTGVYCENVFYKNDGLLSRENAISVDLTKGEIDKFLVLINQISSSLKKDYKYHKIYELESGEYLIINIMVKSHVQIPRSVLNHFVDKYNKIYYVNPEENIIRSSYPKSYNTEFGYYSPYFEEYLGKIESQLGEFAKNISDFSNGTLETLILNDIYSRVTKFIEMALFRSPEFAKKINEQGLSGKINRGLGPEQLALVLRKIRIDYLKDMKIFIMVNNTSAGFVIPRSMFSNITTCSFDGMIFPVTLKAAILIIPKEYFDIKAKKYGEDSYIKIEEVDVLNRINCVIYNYASFHKEDVIGRKEDLERILENKNINEVSG